LKMIAVRFKYRKQYLVILTPGKTSLHNFNYIVF